MRLSSKSENKKPNGGVRIILGPQKSCFVKTYLGKPSGIKPKAEKKVLQLSVVYIMQKISKGSRISMTLEPQILTKWRPYKLPFLKLW